MSSILFWILGLVLGIIAFFFINKALLASKVLSNNKNRTKTITIISAIAGGCVFLLSSYMLNSSFGGEKGKYGLITGLFYDPNWGKKVEIGTATTYQESLNKNNLLNQKYGAKLCWEVMDMLKVKADSSKSTWESIQTEAEAWARANFLVQVHVLNGKSIQKIWPFDYDWQDVWNWCFLKAELQWYGFEKSSLGYPYKLKPEWAGKTINDLAECHKKWYTNKDQAKPC